MNGLVTTQVSCLHSKFAITRVSTVKECDYCAMHVRATYLRIARADRQTAHAQHYKPPLRMRCLGYYTVLPHSLIAFLVCHAYQNIKYLRLIVMYMPSLGSKVPLFDGGASPGKFPGT